MIFYLTFENENDGRDESTMKHFFWLKTTITLCIYVYFVKENHGFYYSLIFFSFKSFKGP